MRGLLRENSFSLQRHDVDVGWVVRLLRLSSGAGKHDTSELVGEVKRDAISRSLREGAVDVHDGNACLQ